MKRSPIQRRTPLRKSGKFGRRTPEFIPADVRAEVVARSGGRCEVNGPSCTERVEHLHHRLRRSQGGQHTVDNLLGCCAACHGHVHANPTWAYAWRFLIRSGEQ